MSMRYLLSATLLLASAAANAAAQMPLTVGDVVTGPASHVRVTNTSSQPVTAWSLAATSKSPSGGTHREVYTTDGYLSEMTHGIPGSDPRLERLLPGQSRELPLDPLPAGSTVEVIVAVLDEGKAVGDEEVIAQIFSKRMKERDALKAVVDAFAEVVPTTHGAEALAALKQRFTALAQRDESIPCRAALDAVQQYERQRSAGAIDQSLQTYAGFVAREYQLAAKHATRRN
jgi:predicted transcriptional regulator